MSYKKLNKPTVILCMLTLIVFSCKKNDPPSVSTTNTKLKNCLVVLNEGLFQQNNASLSMVHLNNSDINSMLFEEKTGRPLGDTGNDMQVYDGKIFIVVNVSSTIEILDESTGASIKQIQMVENGSPKQPRFITFNGNKAYITCYDGYVDVLDLTTLSIVKRIKVGANPEQLAVANNKIFVANSGGLNFPNVDSTVSVISLVTEEEIKKITVGINPGPISVDNHGEVYVISRGNYSSIPSKMHRLSSISDTRIETFDFEAVTICKMNDYFLISYENSGTNKVLKFDSNNEVVVNNDFIDISTVNTFYGIQYSIENDKIYLFDANGYVNTGYVLEYNSLGSYIQKYHVGLLPNKILYYE